MQRLNQKGCPTPFLHPELSRRVAIQAGAVGLLRLGTNHLSALRDLAAASEAGRPAPRAARSSTSFCRVAWGSKTVST